MLSRFLLLPLLSLAVLEPAAPAGCSATGAQSILVVPVHNPGTVPPAAVTQSFLDSVFFGPVSVAGYWAEASYGRASVQGRVLAWRPLTRAFACSETFAVLDEALRLVESEADLRAYNRIVLVWPRPAGCTWTGMAMTECLDRPVAGGTVVFAPAWLNAGSMTTAAKALQLAIHELGHTLGLEHANARDHGELPVGPPGVPGTVTDYGDPHSAMGAWNTGHYDARQKLQLGWLDPAQVAEVESGGTWMIEPVSAPQAGLKALRVRRGSADAWFWIEFRQKLGPYDSTLTSYAFNGALVRYQDRWSGARSELLDMTPATASFADAPLAKGRSFTDPHAGLTIKVNSVSATAASITVDTGAGQCARTPATVALAPTKPAAAPGALVTLTASVTNNDSVSCASSTFLLSSPSSAGLPALLLGPGQTATAAVPIAAPAVPGAYPIELNVKQDAASVKARVTLTVQ